MKKIGIGIVGLGLAVKPHVLALRELTAKVDVIGAYSPSAARREGFAQPRYPDWIEIAGTRGSAVLEGERLSAQIAGQATVAIDGAVAGGGGADPMAFDHGPHRKLIEDFVDAIAEGRAPRVSGRSALAVHALIDAMLASSASGGPVAVAVP